MHLREFALERYFARWEFDTHHNLCASDVEGIGLRELLTLADPEVRDRWDTLTLGYTEPAGMPLLRQEIAALYPGVDDDEIYTFAGAEEAIFILMQTILAKGDHAVVVTPAYQALYDVARGIGATVTEVRLDESRGWELDADVVIEALRPDTRAVVVNAPHSPTGSLPTVETMQRISDAADAIGAYLVIDEVYRYLEFDTDTRLPSAVEFGDHGVTIGVMSKSFGLAGLRIGWLATHDKGLLAKASHLKDYTTICNSVPAEVLAVAGLRAKDALLSRAMGMIQPNLALLQKAIEERDYLRWVPPVAGSVGFVELLADEPIDVFADDLAKEAGVLILPGSVFDVDTHHFRVGLGRNDVADSLERFCAFADTRFGRT